jgi:ADP-ribose pyrophosphatase
MEKLIFNGRRFQVFTEEFKGHIKEIVRHPGAVVILPILEDGRIVLIKNERFVVNQILWELPAGTIEKDENPLHTAQREIIEETGYKAEKMDFLLSFYSTPGFCDEILYVYVAKSLTHVGQQLEETEKISVHPVTLTEIWKMIYNKDIQDGKTIASLLYYKLLIDQTT